MLASFLTLLKLSSFVWLGPCNHCRLACYSDLSSEHLLRTVSFAALLGNNLHFLWPKYCLIVFLALSQLWTCIYLHIQPSACFNLGTAESIPMKFDFL